MKNSLLPLLVIAGLVLWSQSAAAADSGDLDPTMDITDDPSTWPTGDRIWDVCRAVAIAEGFNVGPGAAPFDLNNPGDLSPGDENGCATAGPPEYHGGSYVIFFATAADGWQALYMKFANIASGRSSVYSASMTWQQIATKYAGDSGNWAKNVAKNLGVSVTSTFAQYLGS